MLFKTTIELKEYSELTSAINFNSLKATLNHVETVHIIPVLGKELYNSLNKKYNEDENGLSNNQKNLLEHCRRVIAPYLAYYYASKSSAKLSDSGLQRLETATNKTAFQYQETNFKEANLLEAEQQTEILLQFLFENQDSYAQWQESKEFASFNALFIKTGGEFDQYFKSHSPYRNYFAMRPKMLQVEQQNIRHAIGDNLFNTLKSKTPDTASSYEKELIEKLKFSIAHFTVSFSIPWLAVRIDANGINISGTQTANRDKQSKEQSAAVEQLSLLISEAKETGAAWLNDAVAYIKKNAAQFDNWTEETETTPIDGTQPITDYNTGLKGSFIL